ncbi:hypothetical protein GGR51DRAFT_177331 [Nemania sp. FL0031]|nr:hypothetical protein GGR51DRAFT_177331 [Nemania sp. FL0031]
MSGLLGVPLEVLLQITSYLTTPEYGNLRITCRQVEALLFGAFAREFFSKRQFALIEFSLQALVNIAKSRFGSSLTHLIIHVEHPYTQFGNPTDSSPFRLRAIKENRLRIERFNHMQFTTTGLDAEMLTEAITRLPNLETIGMRDFNSGSRHRDNTSWASYGCPTFLKEAGPLALPGDDHFRSCGPEYTSHVFLTILRAIGNAALDGLIAKARLPYIHVEGDNGEIIPASGYFLSRFLARASSLEHLRLNFQKYEQSATEKVLLWLAGARVNAIGSSASSNVRSLGECR